MLKADAQHSSKSRYGPVPSIRARLIMGLLHVIDRKKIYRSAEALRRAAAERIPSGADVKGISALVSVEGDVARDREVVILKPRNSVSNIILYLHGGSWVFPAQKYHWRFVARLAREANANIHAALYPLAPAHTYDDVMAFLLPVYRELIGRTGMRLIVMGDSVGGSIALSLLLTAREEGLPMPARLVLISPVVDPTFSNSEMAKMEARDPLLALAGPRAAAVWYAGGLALEDRRISPLRGPLAHLPRTQLFIGTNDLLLPDNRLLRDKAVRQGVALDYHEAPGLMHDWPIIPFIPEARRARRQIADFISKP